MMQELEQQGTVASELLGCEHIRERHRCVKVHLLPVLPVDADRFLLTSAFFLLQEGPSGAGDALSVSSHWEMSLRGDGSPSDGEDGLGERVCSEWPSSQCCVEPQWSLRHWKNQ